MSLIISCKQDTDKLKVGNVYASLNENHKYTLFKIIKKDADLYYTKQYNNEFDQLPENINTKHLDNQIIIGEIKVNMETIKFTKKSFDKEEEDLIFIKNEIVTQDELKQAY